MAIAPWNVLAAGKIRTDEEEKKRLESGEGGRSMFGDWVRTEEQRKICQGIEKVAKEVGAKHITSGSSPHRQTQLVSRLNTVFTVAIAWCMQKAPYVFPIVGGRKVEHLYANIEALEISLSNEQIAYLDSLTSFDKGFPYTSFVRSPVSALFLY